MSFEMSWLRDQKVVHQRYYGALTADYLAKSSAGLKQYHQAGLPPIHIVADASNIGKFPANIADLRKANAHFKELDNIGWSLVITSNRFVIFVSTLLSEAANVRFRAFPTLEEALKFLAEQDPTLDLSN